MKLDAYIRENGLTDAAFAEKVDRDRSAVSRWRSGATVPDADSLKKILEATGGAVTPNDFFELPAEKVA